MSPQWLQSDLALEAEEVWRFSRCPLGAIYLQISDQNDFSNFWIYVAPIPPIKSGFNPHYGLGGVLFKESQYNRSGTHFVCQNGTNLAVLNLHVSPLPPTKFQLNPIYRSKADVVSRFSSWPQWRPSCILEQKLAILNLHVTPLPPTKFGLNSTYRSGAKVVWRFSNWPPWRPSWISERTILAFLNRYEVCC